MKKKYRKLEQLKEFAKSYKSSETNLNNNKKNLLKSKEGIANLTESSCIRPDIYLDNDRNCGGCPYFDHCICSIKSLEKKRKKNKYE
jgi:hypothetical protein